MLPSWFVSPVAHHTSYAMWRKDGTCEILLSFILVNNGDTRVFIAASFTKPHTTSQGSSMGTMSTSVKSLLICMSAKATLAANRAITAGTCDLDIPSSTMTVRRNLQCSTTLATRSSAVENRCLRVHSGCFMYWC